MQLKHSTQGPTTKETRSKWRRRNLDGNLRRLARYPRLGWGHRNLRDKGTFRKLAEAISMALSGGNSDSGVTGSWRASPPPAWTRRHGLPTALTLPLQPMAISATWSYDSSGLSMCPSVRVRCFAFAIKVILIKIVLTHAEDLRTL